MLNYQNYGLIEELPLAAAATVSAGWQPVTPEIVRIAPSKAAKPFTDDVWLGNVPTVFVANGGLWTAYWDGPARKPFPVSLQLLTGDQWIGNVPTPFVANGWISIWDGPPRKRVSASLQQFDLPVLAAYATGPVTIVEGWRNQDERPLPRRRLLPSDPADVLVPTVQPVLVSAVFETVLRFRIGQVGAIDSPLQVQISAIAPQDAGWDWRPALRMKQQAEPLWPPNVPPAVATPGNADLWSSVSYAFRPIRPLPPDMVIPARALIRIASQPTLLGVSTEPSLKGRV